MCFNQTEFGQRIKELRKISRMTQEQLSEELNISVEQLRKMECGCRGTSIDLLISIAGYFNVSTDYLLRDEIEEQEPRIIQISIQENGWNPYYGNCTGSFQTFRRPDSRYGQGKRRYREGLPPVLRVPSARHIPYVK